MLYCTVSPVCVYLIAKNFFLEKVENALRCVGETPSLNLASISLLH